MREKSFPKFGNFPLGNFLARKPSKSARKPPPQMRENYNEVHEKKGGREKERGKGTWAGKGTWERNVGKERGREKEHGKRWAGKGVLLVNK